MPGDAAEKMGCFKRALCLFSLVMKMNYLYSSSVRTGCGSSLSGNSGYLPHSPDGARQLKTVGWFDSIRPVCLSPGI